MIRHGAYKTSKGVQPSKAVVYFGLPISIVIKGDIKSSYSDIISKLSVGLEDEGDDNSLLKNGDYVSIAKQMFPQNNPLSNSPDIKGDEFYTEAVPNVILKGIITPQQDEHNNHIFNGSGTITIAEVLDGINAIYNGANSNLNRSKSVDNISYESDYFNEGYNRVCRNYASPFFNLYQRSELFRPITRLEFAYILVICSGIFKGVFDTKYPMGITFNWLKPNNSVIRFKDWNRYNVGLISNDGILSHKIVDYRGDRTVTDMLHDIKIGKTAIPLPMFMSMVELGVQNMFYFDDDCLNPLRELTRGEFSYCINNIMQAEKGDNHVL